MFQITITVHAKSRRFGYLGDVIETTVETTDDERIRQYAFGGSMLATFAARRLDLGAEVGSSAGGFQLFRFERGTVKIEIGPDVAEPAEAEQAADTLAELEAESAEIAALSAERDAELQAEQPAGRRELQIGDAAIFILNGERFPVTIESVEHVAGGTRHDVKLGAAAGGCQAGEIVANCYSFASARLTRMYGDTRSIYPAPAPQQYAAGERVRFTLGETPMLGTILYAFGPDAVAVRLGSGAEHAIALDAIAGRA